jgi:hypothetical protein
MYTLSSKIKIGEDYGLQLCDEVLVCSNYKVNYIEYYNKL